MTLGWTKYEHDFMYETNLNTWEECVHWYYCILPCILLASLSIAAMNINNTEGLT